MEVLFKKIAVEQLSNLLSKYIEEVDEKSLNTASDSVTLKSLALKENDLPGVGLRVKGGYIKTLQIQVPWKRLKKESVVVTVDEVFVVLGARAVTAADRAYAWNQCLANKRAKLDIAETEEEKGYLARYLDTIKQNLTVNVTNVTVVMELDDWERSHSAGRQVEKAHVPRFRIRLTVGQIKLETCTMAKDGRGWEPGFVDESTLAKKRQSKKQITVTNIAVRMCDKPAERHLEIFEHVEVAQADEEETYGRKVLDKLNLRLRLKLLQSTDEADRRDVTMPEVVGHLEASECNLVFNRFQYTTLIGVKLQDLWRPDELRTLVHATAGGALTAQPLARPRKAHSAAQWWRFAISTVMHSAAVMHRQNSGRISWKYFCDLVLVGRPYMKVWKRKLRKFDLSEADKQTVLLAEGFKRDDMLGGNKGWVPGRLCTADVLYFRELAAAEKEYEDARAGNRREQTLSALKALAPSKAKEIGVKETTNKAKSKFSRFKGLGAGIKQSFEAAQEKAQEMADKAQEFALIGVEEDVADDEVTEFVWIDKTEVGNESSRIPISEVKIGTRYYAEDEKRIVKTSEAEPPRVTRPRPPPEDVTLRLSGQSRRGSRDHLPDPEPEPEPAVLPAAGGILPGIPSPRDKGPMPLTQEERVDLYRKKGILNDEGENELSSLALNPEYVRIEMRFELGRFSLSLAEQIPESPGGTRYRSPEPTVFAGLNVAGLSLRALFRPDSIKFSGRILHDLSLDARPVMGTGDGTKLLELKTSAGLQGKENLVQFTFDTLTNQTEVSARLVIAVASVTVQVVPAPIADMIGFFMPGDQKFDTAHVARPSAGRNKRERTRRLMSKAKHISKKLGAGKQTATNVVAATQRKSYIELSVTTKALELVVPEDGGNSGGAFHLSVAKVELDSTDHALVQPGMFDRSCHAVKAAVTANSHAVETARAKKWCQNVTVQLCEVSLSYSKEPVSEESDRECIVAPASITGHFALAQQPGPLGPPEGFLAASILVPSINISASPDCMARLVRLGQSAQPLLPKPKDRAPVTPHPIKEMPHEDLDSFVNLASRATMRLWVQIGTGAGDSTTGIVLRTSAASVGKVVGVVAEVPSITIGLLRCANERTDRQPQMPSASGVVAPSILDTYLEATLESANVSFVDDAGHAVGPPVISMTPASASFGVRVEFASQMGWQPGGAEHAYCHWPISISEDDKRVWQHGDTKFQLVNVHVGNCIGGVRLEDIKILKEIKDEFVAQETEWRAAPKRVSPPSHTLLQVTATQLAVNCFLDNQSDTLEESESSSHHACMNLSDIAVGQEFSQEPITSECDREVFVSIGGVRATLSQNGVDLDLVPDGQDKQTKVKFKFADRTPPVVPEGIPLQEGHILQPKQSLQPRTLELDIHAIMVWIYPSLIRMLHELLQKSESSLDHELAKQVAVEQAMQPMEIYVNISDCDVLLSTTDPTTTSSKTQLVVGVHLQSFLIPPTTIGIGDETEAQNFELSIGDQDGGLRIYTGRLGTDGITAKRTLLEDVVLRLQIGREREGYVVDMESGNICVNLDGAEATALLGLLSLSKLWTSRNSLPSLSEEHLDAESSSDEDDLMDALQMGGYSYLADASQESAMTQQPWRMKLARGRAEIPCIRFALSTDGNDVAAILVQRLEADISNDSMEASIFAVALSDCGASERGLCVIGMGPWADLQEEPTIEEGLKQAEDHGDDWAMQLKWRNKPMDETSNPLDGDEAGDMIDVTIARVHVKLTPRFCKRCVDWVSTVWEDREEFTEEVGANTRPPEAEEGDWVLREDHCIETTVHLGTLGGGGGSSGMKRHNRLFVERPAGVTHTTVTLSGGSLSAPAEQNVAGTSALVYVGADVNLVLQDVSVENFDASLFSLGPGATVSGSVNLDGTELWDSGLSSSKLKARRKRVRRSKDARSIKAVLQANELQITSVHSFGSFTFEFGLSLATTIQDHHTRIEFEGKRISLLSVGVEENATQLFYMPVAVVMYDTSTDDGRAFVRVDLGPVPIVLSNRISKAAFWAGNQWLEVVKSASQLGAELARAEPKEVRKKRLEIERKKRQEAAMSTLITSIQCPEIEVLMLNDTSSLENGGKQLAMKLNIQSISSDSHRILMPDADNPEGHMHNQGKIEFKLALELMNPSNAAWEPLCEQFPFQLDANRDGPKDVVVDIQIGSSVSQITKLSESPQHGSVEISLTPTMLDVFQQTADYWMRSLSAAPPIDTADANFLAAQKVAALGDEVAELCSDLQFRNDLPDLCLQYRCGPAFQTSYDDGEPRLLAAGEQMMLNLRYASESDERYLTITMEGYSTQRFQVEEVKSEVISFRPKDMIDGTETRVVVSVVHNLGNLKVISVRSPVFVSNKCTEDICMQLIGVAGETGTIIAPGKGVSIPPTSKSMKIRPSVPGLEAVYGWSSVLWRSPTDVEPQRIVTCDAIPGVGAMPYHYGIERRMENQPGARHQGLTIEVFAPVLMVNLLPVRLEYFVYRNASTGTSLLEGHLEHGAESILYTLPEGAHVEFKCAGFHKGKRYKIPALRDIAVRVELPDGDNQILELQMQSEQTKRAAYQLTVWCAYWVINNTGLRLRYASDDTFAYNAFPGPAASDLPGEPFLVSQTKMAVSASACGGMAAKNPIPPESNCAALNAKGERDYETGWSKAFSTGTVGTAGVFSLTNKSDNSWRFDIGTNISLGIGKFRRVKIVSLHAQYTVLNRLTQPILVRQSEADLSCAISVQPGQTAPLYWPHRDRALNIVMRIDSPGHMWSAKLAFESAHNLGLPMFVRSQELMETPPFVIACKTVPVSATATGDGGREGVKCNLVSGNVVQVLSNEARTQIRYTAANGNIETGWINNVSAKGAPVLEPFDTQFAGQSLSGYLEKAGEVRTAFKKRFFMYSWPKLHYYESNGGECKGYIDVRDVTAVQCTVQSNTLSLVTETRTFVLKSPKKDFETWKSILLCALIPMHSDPVGVTADVTVNAGSQTLTVTPADPLAPAYLIQNHVDTVRVWVSQKDSTDGREIMVGPNQSKVWMWPESVGARRVNFRIQDTRPDKQGIEIEKDYGLDKIKEHKPLVIADQELVFISNVRGLTKVTHIYTKMRKPGTTRGRTERRNSVDLTNGAGLDMQGQAAETGEMKLEVKVPQIGISLVGKRLFGNDWGALGLNTDIIYLSMRDVEVKLAQRMNGEQSMEVVADQVQIDNGNRLSPFPVVFRSAQTDGGHKALFQFSVVKCAKEMGPNAFRMIQVLLQEADIVVDEELVAAMMMFIGEVKFGDDDDAVGREHHEEDFSLSISAGDKSKQVVKAETIFCEFLQIHPICFHVTYASSAGIDMGQLGVSSFLNNNPLLDILANVDAAPLKLNSLVLSDLVTTKDQATELVVKHYKRQGVLELYKLMGTVDLLGNPMGLVTGVASGVMDFFYEPGQALMTNPSELGAALGKGTKSLIGGTIGGSMNTVSKMTGAVGKGLGSLTMDESYITQRRGATQAEDAADGLVKGVEHLGAGMLKGMTGIVTNPYKEGKKSGASGFMKGVGKGLVGAVVKPAAGVLDLASNVSSGIQATATGGTAKAIRTRPPRAPVYDANAPLAVYDIRKALACELVVKYSTHKTLTNQMKEKLLDCVPIDAATKFFLLTDQRVMIVDLAAAEAPPLSISLHQVSSSSKGPSGTTLDLMYEAVDKKTKQLSLELTGVMGDRGDEADRKKTDQLAMTVLIRSAESKRRFLERGR